LVGGHAAAQPPFPLTLPPHPTAPRSSPAGSAQDNSAFAAQNGLQVLAFEGGDGRDVEFARGAASAAADKSTLAQVGAASFGGSLMVRRAAASLTPSPAPPPPHPPFQPLIPTPNARPHPQVIVSNRADVIGTNIRDTGFRSRFDAAVIAVKRNNVKQGGRLGDVVLKKGDVLVLSVGAGFDPKNPDFARNFRK
jgi:hypothetical protein